jgi:hypothetical protein
MIKKLGVYLLILFVCLSIGLKNAYTVAPTRDFIVIDLTSSEAGTTELFYDSGNGFNATERIEFELIEVGEPTQIAFQLPESKSIQRLRWDPVYSMPEVIAEVTRVYFSYYDAEIEIEVPLDALVPANHIHSFESTTDEVRFVVGGTDSDPYLFIEQSPEKPELPQSPWLHYKAWGFSLLAALLLSGLYRSLVWYFNS